jgi:hypothetical protein
MVRAVIPWRAGSMPKLDPQTIVAVAIVFCLGTIGMALVIAVTLIFLHNATTADKFTIAAVGALGTIVGALATALNAPTGVLSIISAAKAPPPAEITGEPLKAAA